MMTHPADAAPLILPARVAADKAISGIAKVVYAVIASSRGLNGLCTEKLAAIAEAAGASDRAVRDALSQLVDGGYLSRLHDPHRPSAWVVLPVGGNCRPQSAETADTSRQKLPTPLPPVSRQKLPTAAPEPEENQWVWEDQSAETAAPHARAASSSLSSLKEASTSIAKKVDEGKGVRGKPQRAPRHRLPIPDGFVPTARTLAIAADKFPEKDASYELQKFIRYWTEGNGAGQPKSDWDGAFLNWMEKAWATPPGSAAAPGGARAADGAGRLSATGQRLLAMARGEAG